MQKEGVHVVDFVNSDQGGWPFRDKFGLLDKAGQEKYLAIKAQERAEKEAEELRNRIVETAVTDRQDDSRKNICRIAGNVDCA